MSNREHFSATQIEMACRCGEQYRRRYICGEIIPPGIAMAKGKSVHEGARINFAQKLKSGKDLPHSDIIDAAVQAFAAQERAGIVLTDEEISRGAKIVLGQAKDQVARLAEAHARTQAPEYQPVLVEEQVRISMPSLSRDLLAIIDLTDDAERVIDLKTTNRKKRQDEADSSIQLTVYTAAYHARFGRRPRSLRLDVLVETAKGIVRQEPLETNRSDRDLQALAQRIVAVEKMIQTGTFLPATPGAWWCSPRFCGYWATCPYVNSERRAAAEGE